MRRMFKHSNLLFLKSALAKDGISGDIDYVLKWIKSQADAVDVIVKKTSFDCLKSWSIAENGRLEHDTGRFFSIDGIRVQTNWDGGGKWDQPIINQPEIGYLGFITKEFDGVLHFLVQAKIEPGNLNKVQLSPTLQATRSNYTQVHKGNKPPYLDHFREATPEQILVDQLQSEQGARFLRKRNRNIIIKIDEDIPVKKNFIWLTLWQLKKLMHYENVVNMDTRTVVSGITYGSFESDTFELVSYLLRGNGHSAPKDEFLHSTLSVEPAVHTEEEIITFLTHLKSIYDLDVERIPLPEVQDWIVSNDRIHHKEDKYFEVIAVSVAIEGREVGCWDQPMIHPMQSGICALVCKKINGVLHFIVQAKLECGNHDIIELAPTVQCLTGNYISSIKILPFLEYVLNAKQQNIVLDVMQSEEGGRFYQEMNRNIVILADDDFPEELPPTYIWMTLNQLHRFLKFNNYLNIQIRSLIAALPFT
ncbi:NDP-hexose 2,3-dehydratase [Marinifilum sp. JC120]|nr:NDP-hexose 2,3-dehydratase [Marinifilum sp. JC120]